MRELFGTLAAMLAIAAFTAFSLDGGWDSHGDRTARSLPGSDHASSALVADVSVDQNEERSRGRISLES
jgi:hypothetical protein